MQWIEFLPEMWTTEHVAPSGQCAGSYYISMRLSAYRLCLVGDADEHFNVSKPTREVGVYDCLEDAQQAAERDFALHQI